MFEKRERRKDTLRHCACWGEVRIMDTVIKCFVEKPTELSHNNLVGVYLFGSVF